MMINESCCLHQKTCIPCEGGIPPFNMKQINELKKNISEKWKVIGEHHLEREYFFDDFAKALKFTNTLSKIAKKEGHYPDIYLTWGKVKVMIWTHNIDGLTESDFILASKYDQLDKRKKWWMIKLF